jgi:putative phosphoribosyl transferase
VSDRSSTRKFRDRAAAGKALAPLVIARTSPPSVVLGIPHGGVATARPIATALSAPLAALWVRKLAHPANPDVVVGAVDLEGDVTLNVDSARAEGLTGEDIAELAYHGHKALLRDWERSSAADATSLLPGATAIIVDDALVTGLTLRAAARWARKQNARRVVLAVPVVDGTIWRQLAGDADELIAVEERDGVYARSDVFDRYQRISDDEMARLLG